MKFSAETEKLLYSFTADDEISEKFIGNYRVFGVQLLIAIEKLQDEALKIEIEGNGIIPDQKVWLHDW